MQDNNYDHLDQAINRVLHQLSVPPVSDNLADSILRKATALKQEKPVGFSFKNFLAPLFTPWPLHLQQKAALLGLVAVICFGSGLTQAPAPVITQDQTSLSVMDDDVNGLNNTLNDFDGV